MARVITFNLLIAPIKPQVFDPTIQKLIGCCHSGRNTHKQGQSMAPDPNNVIFITLPVFGESSASIWKYLQPFPPTDLEIAITNKKPTTTTTTKTVKQQINNNPKQTKNTTKPHNQPTNKTHKQSNNQTPIPQKGT